jgi:hypothetical protein
MNAPVMPSHLSIVTAELVNIIQGAGILQEHYSQSQLSKSQKVQYGNINRQERMEVKSIADFVRIAAHL